MGLYKKNKLQEQLLKKLKERLLTVVVKYRNSKEYKHGVITNGEFLSTKTRKRDILHYKMLYFYLLHVHSHRDILNKDICIISGIQSDRVSLSCWIRKVTNFLEVGDSIIVNDLKEIIKLYKQEHTIPLLQQELEMLWTRCYNTLLEDVHPEFYYALSEITEK